MKKKQTIKTLFIAAGLAAMAFTPLFISPLASAATECGGVQTSLITCGSNDSDNNGDGKVDEKDSGVWSILLIAINILTAGVGVLALAGIVYGSVLYTSAGGSPEQIKKARTIFVNVVVGIVAFAGMWGLLNFIIPGGVF